MPLFGAAEAVDADHLWDGFFVIQSVPLVLAAAWDVPHAAGALLVLCLETGIEVFGGAGEDRSALVGEGFLDLGNLRKVVGIEISDF